MHSEQLSSYHSNNQSDGMLASTLSAVENGRVLRARILTIRYKHRILQRRLEYLIQLPDQRRTWVLAPRAHGLDISPKSLGPYKSE